MYEATMMSSTGLGVWLSVKLFMIFMNFMYVLHWRSFILSLLQPDLSAPADQTIECSFLALDSFFRPESSSHLYLQFMDLSPLIDFNLTDLR